MLYSAENITKWLKACQSNVTLERVQALHAHLVLEINHDAIPAYRKAVLDCTKTKPKDSEPYLRRAALQQKLQVLVPTLRLTGALISQLKTPGFKDGLHERQRVALHLAANLTKTPPFVLGGQVDRNLQKRLMHQFGRYTNTHSSTALELIERFADLFPALEDARPTSLLVPGAAGENKAATPALLKNRLHRKVLATCSLEPEEKVLLNELFGGSFD